MTSNLESNSDGRSPLTKVPLPEQLYNPKAFPIERYRRKVVGDISLFGALRYEIITMFLCDLPGALGYTLRRIFYKSLFGGTGSGLILGKGVVLRHPSNILIGEKVAIDDYVLLDASEKGSGIRLGDRVIISRNCVLRGKNAPITIDSDSNLGVNVLVSSLNGIYLGKSVLIGGNCSLGGGQYFNDRIDIPIMEQGIFSRGPVIIGDGSWLGANVVVLDGVQIGKGCIVGAGAVVTKDLPDYAVAVGNPARIIRMRIEQ